MSLTEEEIMWAEKALEDIDTSLSKELLGAARIYSKGTGVIAENQKKLAKVLNLIIKHERWKLEELSKLVGG